MNYPKTNVAPAKGIRLLPIKETGEKRYGVVWGKARASEFFSTIELLDTKIAELNELKDSGELAMVPTKEELQGWRAFRANVGPDVDIMDVLTGWKAWRASLGKPVCDMTVAAAVLEYLKDEEARVFDPSKPVEGFKKKDSITYGTFKQKRCKLQHFSTRFGAYKLDEVTQDEIEEWLEGEAMKKTIKSGATYDSYVGKVGELYRHFKEKCPKSPTEEISKSEDSSNIKDLVYPVRDVARVMKYARDHQPWMLIRLATEFFTGARFSTAGRLEKKAFNLEDCGIDIDKSIIKTKKDRYIDCMPKNWLPWAKLGYHQADAWSMSLTDYMHAKSKLFELAEVETRHNGCRHSLASYSVAAFNNPGLTATLLCHSNQKMLFDTYLGKAKKADALRYFTITPKTVDQLAA